MPYFTEWKMLAQQDYVVGFEPGICIPEGRLSARKNGRLRTISPGEEHQIAYEIGVLDGLQEIKDIIKKV